MRKDNSKQRKIERNQKTHTPLDEFYSAEQKQAEVESKHRKAITDQELEIFEHLKNHTKKLLKK